MLRHHFRKPKNEVNYFYDGIILPNQKLAVNGNRQILPKPTLVAIQDIRNSKLLDHS